METKTDKKTKRRKCLDEEESRYHNHTHQSSNGTSPSNTTTPSDNHHNNTNHLASNGGGQPSPSATLSFSSPDVLVKSGGGGVRKKNGGHKHKHGGGGGGGGDGGGLVSESSNSITKRKGSKRNEKESKKTLQSKKDLTPPSEDHGDHHDSDDTLEEEIRRLQPLVIEDAGKMYQHFEEAYGKVCCGMPKPNVLLTGITGAGKSSLINAIFGKHIAATGTGVPITQHFTKYCSEDMRVVIYDSKGLEHGYFQDFIASTNTFFDQHQISENSKKNADAIHVIWYIINSAHSRFEPFEETICRKLFNRAPVIFILNKADISTPADRKKLREIITDMNLPNCMGIYDVVASPQTYKVEIDECPKCKSDDIIIKKRQATMLCADCGYEQSVKADDGLESVIAATITVLPKVVRTTFISAQSVSFTLKEQSSQEVIVEFWKQYATVRSPAGLIKRIAKMMASLSLVWEFKKHEEYGTKLAHDLMSDLNWKDQLSLLFRLSEDQRLHGCALGVLWNRCLRDMAVVIFRNWAQEDKQSGKLALLTCRDLYEQVFEQFNEENLVIIEETLEERGLEQILKEEKERVSNKDLDELISQQSPTNRKHSPTSSPHGNHIVNTNQNHSKSNNGGKSNPSLALTTSIPNTQTTSSTGLAQSAPVHTSSTQSSAVVSRKKSTKTTTSSHNNVDMKQ